MFIGVARFELFLVTQPHSLKQKRSIVNRVKAHLRNKLEVSISEVDFQDVWQRCAIGLACVSGDQLMVRRLLERASELLETCHDVEVTDEVWEVQSW